MIKDELRRTYLYEDDSENYYKQMKKASRKTKKNVWNKNVTEGFSNSRHSQQRNRNEKSKACVINNEK